MRFVCKTVHVFFVCNILIYIYILCMLFNDLGLDEELPHQLAAEKFARTAAKM